MGFVCDCCPTCTTPRHCGTRGMWRDSWPRHMTLFISIERRSRRLEQIARTDSITLNQRTHSETRIRQRLYERRDRRLGVQFSVAHTHACARLHSGGWAAGPASHVLSGYCVLYVAPQQINMCVPARRHYRSIATPAPAAGQGSNCKALAH